MRGEQWGRFSLFFVWLWALCLSLFFRSSWSSETQRKRLRVNSRGGLPRIRGTLFVVVVFLGLSLMTSCTSDRISIARGSRTPEEAQGFAQVLTDEPIEIGIIGSDVVAEKNIAGYAVLNVEDLEQLLKNTEELHRLRKAEGPD